MNNKRHRKNDKPAYIEYDINGNIKYEVFYINGKLKRLNKNYPTIIEYKNNGNDVVNIFTDKLRREEIFGIWNK